MRPFGQDLGPSLISGKKSTTPAVGVSYTPSSALPLGTYYWPMRPSNVCGESPRSAGRSCRIATNIVKAKLPFLEMAETISPGTSARFVG